MPLLACNTKEAQANVACTWRMPARVLPLVRCKKLMQKILPVTRSRQDLKHHICRSITGTGFSHRFDDRDTRHDETGVNNDLYDFLQALLLVLTTNALS